MRNRISTFVLILFALSSCSFAAAIAGPNANGVLLIHSSLELDYTDDLPDPCGLVDVGDCGSFITNIPEPFEERVWWVTAAFVEGSSPRLMGVTFGVDYNPAEVVITAFGICGELEIPTGSWPAPGEGTALIWSEPQLGLFTDVYWFAGYFYYSTDTEICLIPHPTQGGLFGDDDVPANLDPILDFGCLGFGTNPGYLPCTTPEFGACCLPTGECTLIYEFECDELGGWFIPYPSCDPNPCFPTPTIESTWGKIKHNYR